MNSEYKLNDNTVVVLCGISGSGKSTFAKNLIAQNPDKNCIYLNADTMRGTMFDGKEEIQKNGEYVIEYLYMIFSYFCYLSQKDGGIPHVIIIDNVNKNRHSRQTWIKIAQKFNFNIECILFNVGLEKAIENNKNRDRMVPEKVIEDQYKSFSFPDLNEGFSRIYICRDNKIFTSS